MATGGREVLTGGVYDCRSNYASIHRADYWWIFWICFGAVRGEQNKAVRILVCGGRDYKNVSAVYHALYAIHQKRGITLIIEGGAAGADLLARKWAQENGVPVQTFEAEWEKYGKAAGPKRNERMLAEGNPDGVIAFPGGRGTADMVSKAKAASVKVWQPQG